MSKSRHSEAQIIAALKQVEAGRAVEDLAREYGVSKHTIYAWKSKYGGMEVSEAQEVKQLGHDTELEQLRVSVIEAYTSRIDPGCALAIFFSYVFTFSC